MKKPRSESYPTEAIPLASIPPQSPEPLPDFIGLALLPSRPPLSDAQQLLYKELWNKVAWAMGSSYNCPYRGSTEIRSLARRLVLVIIANADVIKPKS